MTAQSIGPVGELNPTRSVLSEGCATVNGSKEQIVRDAYLALARAVAARR